VITYRQLRDHLNECDEDTLDTDATIFDSEDEEYYPVTDIDRAVGTDVMDDNHLVLIFKSACKPAYKPKRVVGRRIVE